MLPSPDDSALDRYDELKREIDHQFPQGCFVAVDSGQVIAQAASHRALVEQIQSRGLSPNGMLIVQAGVDYPDSAMIFGMGAARRLHA